MVLCLLNLIYRPILGFFSYITKGYSTMCGHAVMALGRYAVDKGIVANPASPETTVTIQCPCGPVQCYVEYNGSKTGRVRFHSVPAFAFALDQEVDVDGVGKIKVDIGYGGAFYAFVPDKTFGLEVRKSATSSIIATATRVSDAVKKSVKLHHPDSDDLAFLYGTIITDGQDQYSDTPTGNVCVFADRQVDRCPTGSGVTARIALQHARGLIQVNQCRTFESGANGSLFTGKAIKQVKCGDYDAVVVEVSGKANYSGTATFTVEEDDLLKQGFLLK